MGSGIDKIVVVVRATPERSVRTAWYCILEWDCYFGEWWCMMYLVFYFDSARL